ncbi:unnamed protein product [Spodoptera exigua]|nr:unnamed protein product [Spodoptera exigua]
MGSQGSGVLAVYDMNAVAIMSYLKGQMIILREKCDSLFDDVTSAQDVLDRIKECHRHHNTLLKHFTLFNSLLSPTMFVYVLMCSITICGSVVQFSSSKLVDRGIYNSDWWKSNVHLRKHLLLLGGKLNQCMILDAGPYTTLSIPTFIEEGTTTVQQIWIAEYLMALIAQLFLYCWHSNDVLYMSNQVDDGVYSSAWWSQNVRTRRSLLLLGGQLRKPIAFNAGPFTKLNMATFVAILKGSYSYYTLVAQKKD